MFNITLRPLPVLRIIDRLSNLRSVLLLFLSRLWRGELPSQTGGDRKRSAKRSRHIGAPGSSGVGRRRAVFALIIGCAVVPLALLSWRSQAGSTARTGQNSSYPYTVSLGWGKPKATVEQDGTASVKFMYDGPLFYKDEVYGHAEQICKTVHRLAENRGDVRTIKVEVCVEFRQFDQRDRYGHFYKVPASTGCDTIPFEDLDEVRKYTESAYIGKMQSTVTLRLAELNRLVGNRQGL
ncbi:MAG TPA: hypothetical protein VE758_06255 [Chthoniobacterales bacterium]|nr:hypothetical protein [Chthoniobacterales bacterium]